jgi:hypothetical protein
MIIKIIKSRFKKSNENEEFIIHRRGVCSRCEFNSNNQSKVSPYKLFLKSLSDFYSWITFNSKKDNLGNCWGCEAACSIYYKSAEAEEVCPKNNWKE